MAKYKFLKIAENHSRYSPEDNYAISPEERLWKAVIERTVSDFREVFLAVTQAIQVQGTYSIQSLYAYQTMKHEISCDWFDVVCEMAGVSRSRVMQILEDEAKASGMFSVEPIKLPKIISKRSEGMH